MNRIILNRNCVELFNPISYSYKFQNGDYRFLNLPVSFIKVEDCFQQIIQVKSPLINVTLRPILFTFNTCTLLSVRSILINHMSSHIIVELSWVCQLFLIEDIS